MLRRFSIGRHGTILITGAVAALSVITGVLHIGTSVTEGPFGVLVPLWMQELTGFTGAVTGFLLAAGVVLLVRGYREGWWLSAVLVPVAGVQAVLQSSVASLPLLFLSLASFAALVATRDRFQQRLTVSSAQLTAVAALIGVQIYGTIGAYALRHEFNRSLSVVDAFYYTIVTVSTVGYGDIVPETLAARLFAVSLIVVGAGSFAAFLGTLLKPALENGITRRIDQRRNRQKS